MSQIKAIVFDIGGVLEYTPRTNWRERWEDKLGLERGQLLDKMRTTWRAATVGAITLADMHAQTAVNLHITAAEADMLMEDLWQEYLGTLNAELYAYFCQLRPRFQTAILSNSGVGAREREQAAYRFGDNCDFIVYSHEVGLSKPDLKIYALLCHRLMLPPQEVIFLDDVPAYVSAAVDFGMHAILFENNAQAIADIEALI